MSAKIKPLFNNGHTPETIVFRYLADCPQHIPALAGWMFFYWGRRHDVRSLHDQIDRLSERLYRNRFPLALVALSGSRPVGTASLKIQEMTTHKHYYHWLGSVFVVPEFRRCGIGTSLISHCESRAMELDISELFLQTTDRELFYRKLGWTLVERSICHDNPVVIMKKQFTKSASRQLYENSKINNGEHRQDILRIRT